MKYSSRLHLTAAAAAVFAALAASSSAAVAAEETVSTETVKVTAARVEQELMDVNMSVSVITADDIARSNARTVGELLKDIPGVIINNDGGQGIKRVKIRGENAFRTLVMIDGQKIAEHKSMSGTPMMIDPSQIERIEVIKGPASVLYGSDAIGGAINIITKKSGQKAFEADVSLGLDTSSMGKQAAFSLAGQKDGWHYRLGGAIETGDNLDTPAGEMKGTYYGTDFETKSANLFIAYDVNENNQVGLTLDHFDNQFNSISWESPDFYVHVPEWKRTKVGVFAESRNLTDFWTRLRVDAFYQKSKKNMVNHIQATGMPMILMPIADNTTDQYGISTQADWQLGENHYLITGYEFEYDKLDATSTTNYAFTRMPTAYDKVTPYNGHAQTHAAFASMESTFGNFVLNYGARYTYVSSEMDATQTTKTYSRPTVSSSVENTYDADKRHDAQVVFNAGVLYNGLEHTTLRASWSQGYRAPILQELYIPTSMGSTGTTYNNPDLKSETSDNFEIGARYLNHGLSLDASLFYNIVDDYIASVPYGTGMMGSSNYIYENIAKAKSYGLELAGSFLIGQTGFEPYANITLIRRQYDNGQGFKTYETGTPLFWARYGVRWNKTINDLAVHTDVFAHTQTASKYDDGKTGVNSSSYRYGGATTFNVAGGVAFGPEKQYKLDMGLYNIGDKKYQNEGAIYEPGRYFAMKFNAHF